MLPSPLSTPTPAPHDLPIDPVLLLPMRKRHLDPGSDPDLFMPLKCMHFLGVGKASTPSGSFVVSKAKVAHLDIGKLAVPVFGRIPNIVHEPDWDMLQWFITLLTCMRDGFDAWGKSLEKELAEAHNLLGAHQVISKGQNTQFIVQNMGMGKLKQSLFEKEKQKKSDCTILFLGGKGQHLTSDKVIEQKRAIESMKAKELTDKATKKAKREEKIQRRSVLSPMFGVENGGDKDQRPPKKPQRPLKPKPKESEADDNDHSDDSEGDVA
ncbi:hypothetical protein K438DRAFT_1963049 [Mycena galopus ATCC 62051]|nr:hypothetical protein K438DRAFT_1963049 [Mycena galopus ATCC 62051]